MSEQEGIKPGTDAELTDEELTDEELQDIDGGAHIDPAIPRVARPDPGLSTSIWGTGGTTIPVDNSLKSFDDPLLKNK